MQLLASLPTYLRRVGGNSPKRLAEHLGVNTKDIELALSDPESMYGVYRTADNKIQLMRPVKVKAGDLGDDSDTPPKDPPRKP